MLVGEAICKANFVDGSKSSWIVKNEGDFCSIENSCKNSSTELVYSIGGSVIGVEIDDECASKVIEPLIDIYGFEKVKWLATKYYSFI